MRSQLYCDFEINIENGIIISNIKCHKFILRARSNFFYSKINKNMKAMTFKNFDISLVKYVIDYIYMNDCLFLDEIKNLDVLLYLLKISKYVLLY